MKRTIDITLLKKAQRGDRESLCALAELARKDVFAYLLRLTLDVHVTEDLCQETIVQMLESLPKLRIATVKSFWAWLYKTAFSRVSHQFRDQGNARLRHRTLSADRFVEQMPDQGHSGPQHLMHKELRSAIWEAMGSVKIRYRNILTLRCFQNLSYAEIALATGGSELQARLLFFRAKRSLRHQLASQGFRKKEQLLPALSLFAALTAGQSKSASAAVMVKAASLNVSAGTMALGLATTKVGVVSLVAAMACITAGVAHHSASTPGISKPRPVATRVKNQDATLLDLLYSPAFQRPASMGKARDPDGNGFTWTDRAHKGQAEPGANFGELLIDKTELDLRVVILPAGHLLHAHFPNPIVDAPGPDILIAGWTRPDPLVEVFGAQSSGIPLANPVELRDTWGRAILGYDLAIVPPTMSINTIRVTGTHTNGPHQGFELHEIRARQ
jgi:RNA polymerase sigma-70 factor, ECF subfamily